jgi:hypothetical protein
MMTGGVAGGPLDDGARGGFAGDGGVYSALAAYAGVDLMRNFKPQLLKMLNLHNGIKFYFDLQCLMVKYLDGEILTQDTRWVSSRRESATNTEELLAKLQSSIDLIKQKIPDLEARYPPPPYSFYGGGYRSKHFWGLAGVRFLFYLNLYENIYMFTFKKNILRNTPCQI